MSIRGKTAIVGIGEIPTRRVYPGRSMYGLCAEAARLAIEDAGIRKQDIDGLITEGGMVYPNAVAEYIGIRPTYAVGVSMMGASSCTSVATAAAAIVAGYCNTVLIVMAAAREPNQPFGRPGAAAASIGSEFEAPSGPAVAANNGYALLYNRHMYEFGTKPEQMAKLAAYQRFNALKNPNAAFQGQAITVEDVLNSRYINEPLHMLECVMPCAGGAACIVTTLERAKALPNPPVVILGAGLEQGTALIWQNELFTTTPTKVSAARAFAMAGYSPKDMDFAEFYDCYTILAATCLEDAGFCKKGEIGPFIDSHDLTYKGDFPVNTDGGQLSGGQPGIAGGFRHVIEGVRQVMRRAGERQVSKSNLCMVNG